jgi:hypothetical protein
MDRRTFLKAGTIAACGVTRNMLAAAERRVAIASNRESKSIGIASGWAMTQLRDALSAKSITSFMVSSVEEARGVDSLIVLNGTDSAREGTWHYGWVGGTESFRLAPTTAQGKPAILLSAEGARGYSYGLSELTERVRFSTKSGHELVLDRAIEEKSATPVRSIARAFVSEAEDKQWYYDKSFWRGYLDTLATSRFNRFSLTFGLGYDFPRGVTGDYFHFPYPYLLDVPGYKVRVVPLDDAERDRNLETLQFIAAETAARGIQFQLAMWTHAYQWTDSPRSDHHIEGLTPATHAAYCRDALALLLKFCPQIEGITLRVHGESGIPEGSYVFWQTLFEAVADCGRKVEIDMHAKGIDQKMIDIAGATGMPVKVSPKFSSEHMGLGYQQADIRQLEWPLPGASDQGTFALSSGSRRFLRYGYGDLFQEGRNFDVLFRVWPGTQHVLLWGDPATAASYGRSARFCGAAGLELCEPLFFKGRQGSGLSGGRCAYADASLDPGQNDWKKFEYTYRVWGRCLYDPDTDAEVFKRSLRENFGPAAEPAYEALANASRVLPLVTTAHLPSASNQSYWPELYTNMGMLPGHSPYSDTPDPKSFGTVSPLDPQLFSSAVEHAHNLLDGGASAKYSPVDVARWLEALTDRASDTLAVARKQSASANRIAFRQMEEDVLIYIGLGRFFAGKMRSAVLLEIYLQTGDRKAGDLAVAALTRARDAWAAMAQRAEGVYRADITYGASAHLRGHWIDRLPAIDGDLAALRDKVSLGGGKNANHSKQVSVALKALVEARERLSPNCSHVPASAFRPGSPLPLRLTPLGRGAEHHPASVVLWYRHVNHAERWVSMPMALSQDGFDGAIPGKYTHSPFPLQYYFELHAEGQPSLYPGFNEDLSNQPYYVVSYRIT